jgi:AbrB family looped-hinge helix DNA binding protein
MEGLMAVEVRMSSKGQLVIPGKVRHALRLKPGSRLQLEVVGRTIVLQPVIDKSPIDELRGMFEGEDLLRELEREHREEIDRD